jgi:polyferredoxin
MTEEMEKSPEKLSKNWRITLNILFFAVVAFVIGYKLISHVELKTTSALFIGLPMLMGLLIVNLSRTGVRA